MNEPVNELELELELELKKYKSLLKIWMIAYEKAIIKNYFRLAKKTIDEACTYAVDGWVQYSFDEGIIPEIKKREFDTIEDAIKHYVWILQKVKMWGDKEEEQPKIKPTDDGENICTIEIPFCSYKEACKWGLEEKHFDPKKGNFRCQRLGCFVAATKKYMAEDKLSESERKQVTYFMTRVHESDGCKGLIFIFKGQREEILKKRHLPGYSVSQIDGVQ